MTRPRSDSPATGFAVALLEEFLRLGVRDITLGPGSRSQALALAAAEFERAGLVRLHVRVDERVAGFVALGLAIETGRPAVIITTSGTAVANLHPAVLEAHHSGVPLIVASGDRPENLRGIGSNQTTTQPGIFGSAVQRTWDVGPPTGEPGERDAAVALAREAHAAAASGPVHLNLAFAEPLSSPFTLDLPPVEGDGSGASGGSSAPGGSSESRGSSLSRSPDLQPQPEFSASSTRLGTGTPTAIIPGSNTVVIAGTGAGPRAEEVARELGVPLLAEISSGAHFGPNLVVAYRDLLRDPEFGGRVRRAIVFGHPTLSREVPALLQRDDVDTTVVRWAGAEDYNPGRRVARFADAVTVDGAPGPREWLGTWVAASRALLEGSPDLAPDPDAGPRDHARRELAAVRLPVDRRMLGEAVWRATWPHDRLVLGASRLIREADRVLPGKRVPVHANRGLAGIDGTISTALGIARASQAGEARGTTRVLLGDLAFFHDAGALLFGLGEVRPRIQVIVGNDHGGTLFDQLEVSESAGSGFDRVILTPQYASIEQLAGAYGWEYRRVENRGQLDQALTASADPVVIEVPLPRE